MDLVVFISCKTGADLIVSFAVCAPEDGEHVESLTLLRTPKYEGLLHEWERGVTVSFEREKNDARAIVLLRQVTYAADEKVVTLTSDRSVYKLDVRKVAPDELKDMCRVLRKMNYDSSVTLEGI